MFKEQFEFLMRDGYFEGSVTFIENGLFDGKMNYAVYLSVWEMPVGDKRMDCRVNRSLANDPDATLAKDMWQEQFKEYIQEERRIREERMGRLGMKRVKGAGVFKTGREPA